MKAIHQFTAGFGPGDAISNQAAAMQDIFRRWGFDSTVFSESKRISPVLKNRAAPLSDYMKHADESNIVILHLSIGSPVNEAFRTLKCKKAILYHNITPPRYFEMINSATARVLKLGREQMKALADSAEINMAVSKYNSAELEKAGYSNVSVVPLILDLNRLRTGSLSPYHGMHSRKKTILFVGRCAPNKKIEDLLDAFCFFHRFVEPESRLLHVGSFAGTEKYYALLADRAKRLGIENAVDFAGVLSQQELNACYDGADAFLCMSEHEGFCIPLFEAMAHDLPVIAYSAGAIPETLDGSGILFRRKQYNILAEMIGRVVGDQDFRRAVIVGQQKRLKRHTSIDIADELKNRLAPLMESNRQ